MNFEAREHSKWQKFKLVQIWVLIRIFQRKIMHQLGSVKAGMLPIWGKVQEKREIWTREPRFASRKQDIWDIEVRDNEMILREMSTKWPRDYGICSRYRQVQDIEYLRYRESTVYCFLSLQHIETKSIFTEVY